MTGTYCDAKKNNDNINSNISGGRTFSGWPNRRHCDDRPPRPISHRPVKGWTIGGARLPPLVPAVPSEGGEEREFQKSNCLRVSLPGCRRRSPVTAVSRHSPPPPLPARASYRATAAPIFEFVATVKPA